MFSLAAHAGLLQQHDLADSHCFVVRRQPREINSGGQRCAVELDTVQSGMRLTIPARPESESSHPFEARRYQPFAASLPVY